MCDLKQVQIAAASLGIFPRYKISNIPVAIQQHIPTIQPSRRGNIHGLSFIWRSPIVICAILALRKISGSDPWWQVPLCTVYFSRGEFGIIFFWFFLQRFPLSPGWAPFAPRDNKISAICNVVPGEFRCREPLFFQPIQDQGRKLSVGQLMNVDVGEQNKSGNWVETCRCATQ